MKTVVENNKDVYRRYSSITVEKVHPFIDNSAQGRSCFYDFAAKSSVEFSGFVENGDCSFIDEIGECFIEK